jgi:hypothetical protein
VSVLFPPIIDGEAMHQRLAAELGFDAIHVGQAVATTPSPIGAALVSSAKALLKEAHAFPTLRLRDDEVLVDDVVPRRVVATTGVAVRRVRELGPVRNVALWPGGDPWLWGLRLARTEEAR